MEVDWFQKYNLKKIARKRKRISEFIIDDETLLNMTLHMGDLGCNQIEPEYKHILAILQKYHRKNYAHCYRNMISLINRYGEITSING